jgi:hypothetical protein
MPRALCNYDNFNSILLEPVDDQVHADRPEQQGQRGQIFAQVPRLGMDASV